jgi:hypothetical protein
MEKPTTTLLEIWGPTASRVGFDLTASTELGGRFAINRVKGTGSGLERGRGRAALSDPCLA